MPERESDDDRHNRELIANGFPKLEKLDRDIFAAFISTAVAITCTMFVISDFLFHRAWAATFTAIVAAAFLGLWYGLPLAAAIRDRRQTPRRAR